MTLEELNSLTASQAEEGFRNCCGSKQWADRMAAARPYSSPAELFDRAEHEWQALARSDWLEAFSHHPRIGEKSLREKFSATAAWASDEQKGVSRASEATLQGLLRGNEAYEKRFGHVFLVCATGRSAEEMLAALSTRIGNDPATELEIAAGEQAKITRIRLEKWLNKENP